MSDVDPTPTQVPAGKRLTRSRTDSMIGVCGGVADYSHVHQPGE